MHPQQRGLLQNSFLQQPLLWWIAILQNAGCSTLGLFPANPLGTDAAGVVLHLPVQDIQLDGCNTGAAHIAIGIGD